ncbi:hypothetical protein [Zwartia panacis]|uniref:hypothetical protein n=1 Tax=Zwartia panacis TaxID=2683345 RepID=UPI0025B5A0C0|nr:hypothetical protein [Zwartia panacis]MDN4017155.1 hypothetical protein [Zwartia panacis]
MSNSSVNTKLSNNGINFIQESATEFKGYARKTAENILEMGRVVFETKSKLKGNKAEFEIFCTKIGFKSTSSSIKKLSQIGKGYTELKSQAQNLPNNWTTLYEISRLTSAELKKYIAEGVIHQNVLGSVIKSINGTHSENAGKDEAVSTSTTTEEVPNGTPVGYSFTCELEDATDVQLKSQIQMIIKTLKDLKVKVTVAPKLKSALQPLIRKAA